MVSACWRPNASFDRLRLRAQLLADIRTFFYHRDVLEVETPLLAHATGTDPNLDFFSACFDRSPIKQTLFLQTSPEFAMKRLLAAGSGSIYQICKAFRNGESGHFHNPEFTILEWYRIDYGLFELMREVDELMKTVLPSGLITGSAQTIAYQALFIAETGLDPLIFQPRLYREYAQDNGFPEAVSICGDDHAAWLDLIFSLKIQPRLGKDSVCLLHGFPAVQSSLARTRPDDPRIAERFEVFVNGVELGNGFHELADAAEQKARFDREITERRIKNLPPVAQDARFLAALEHGLPDCSGVAIGLDRLLMLIAGASTIDEVLAFAIDRA